MDNVINGYSGSSSITDPDLKALNSQYTASSTNINMKVVAYMMDTNAWSVYAGEKAEYAIGGPSLELFVKSYNEHYGTGYTTSANSIGYMINGSTSMVLSKSGQFQVKCVKSNLIL